MFCLIRWPAITWPNRLLDCCVPAPGEATMPCLFVYESPWLWLAASSSAAEHTIGTKGWEKKSCYSFPSGSIHCQSWTSNSGTGMKRGWERLGDGFSMPRSLLCVMRSLLYTKPWASMPLNVFYVSGLRWYWCGVTRGKNLESRKAPRNTAILRARANPVENCAPCSTRLGP